MTGPPGPGAEEGLRALFRRRDFPCFLLARGGIVGGAQVLSVAAGWHVYQRTGEVFDLGLIGLALFLPFIVFFLPAGLLADRVDRRWIVGGCSLVHATSVILIGIFLSVPGDGVGPVFWLLALSGSAQAFLHPALMSTLPTLVSREIFPRAVAASSMVGKGAQLGGPAFGGLLVALVDTRVYTVATGLYLCACVAALSIRAKLRIEAKEPFSLSTLLGGFRHIVETPLVLAAISLDLFAVLFGGVMGLLPVFASDILGVGPEGLGVMRAMPAVGALAMGAMLARIGLPWHAGRALFVSLALFGGSILVLSVSHLFWLSLAMLAIYGASDMVGVNIRQTLVQLRTPDHLRGRVSAVNSVSINASNQLGDFRAGTMAALTGAPAATAIGGLATILIGATWFRLFPGFRAMERA
ncbi:MFS transporter [Rhodobacterales bacterium HKCCE2091]|nr:MFS transporter [Rhodobacterales bacterium HKCCE2091]